MNKYKNFMDDGLTADWLRDNGISVKTFGTTHIRLLQAQQQAHALLTHHSNLLTQSQRTTLEQFQHEMAHKNTRIKLKPTAANPILNISSKINRQLFKQHRHLAQAQH
jgi:acetylornithine/succinyldiaminopimelate/putrescine aminotransferase